MILRTIRPFYGHSRHFVIFSIHAFRIIVFPFPIHGMPHPIFVFPFPIHEMRHPIIVFPFPIHGMPHPIFVFPFPIHGMPHPLAVFSFPIHGMPHLNIVFGRRHPLRRRWKLSGTFLSDGPGNPRSARTQKGSVRSLGLHFSQASDHPFVPEHRDLEPGLWEFSRPWSACKPSASDRRPNPRSKAPNVTPTGELRPRSCERSYGLMTAGSRHSQSFRL